MRRLVPVGATHRAALGGDHRRAHRHVRDAVDHDARAHAAVFLVGIADDGLRKHNASSSSPSIVTMRSDRRREARRQDPDPAARADDPARDGAAVAAEPRIGPVHALHRHAEAAETTVGRDVDVLQQVHQRRALVPRHVRGLLDDVVAVLRRDGDEGQVLHGKTRHERVVVGGWRRTPPRRTPRCPSC